MKKLSLTGAALLCFAALTHAQITQVGASQYAEQNRTGNNQTGAITQVQTENNPERTNFGNYAITFQTAPGDGGTNTANINQNDGSQGNRAGITQQAGSGNLAQIEQNGGPYGLSGGSQSVSATIGRAGELGNFAGIAQMGRNNTASLTQSNLSQQNGSEIYQNGFSNEASLEQKDNSTGNTALILQGYTGQNQPLAIITTARASILQNGSNPQSGGFGESSRNSAIIRQLASDVRAGINQNSYLGSHPSNNLASIDQQAGARSSVAGVSQGTSVGSTAYITQVNRNNIASIVQGGTGAAYSNTARVVQQGAGLESINGSTSGYNDIDIIQGDYGGFSQLNQALVTQASSVDGNGSTRVAQGLGAGANSSRNQAIIDQQGRNTIDNNVYVSINQGIVLPLGAGTSTSQDNQASVIQGSAVINGTIRIEQGAIYEGNGTVPVTTLEATRNVANINQIRGVNVQARIGQGTNLLTFADGNPPGPLSAARSLSGAEFGLGTIARDNRADITQVQGDGNYSLILQSGEQNIGRIVQQAQDNNFAIIVQTQNANRSIATINQLDGSANQATIQQFGSAEGNVSVGTADQAIINQFRGSNNVAFLQQGAPGVSTSGGNYAIVTQNGNANQARFLQQGVGNFVSITQNGDGNQIRNGAGDANSYGSQVGNNNTLRLTQSGGRIFSYTQVGNNNTQLVSQ